MASDKNIPVITISRQYGAGGRTIAKALSQSFDIPWYDKDFVARTAASSGYSEEDIRREGEQLSAGGRFLNSVLNNSAAYASSHDGIFQAQKKVILDLAGSPCIIVGRCANFILREAQIPVFSIFLYADLAFRVRRAEELAEYGSMDVQKFVEKVDAQRDTYCRYYTKHALDDFTLLDVCLNAARLPMEENARVLAEMIRSAAAKT